jgi:hypothetical protein
MGTLLAASHRAFRFISACFTGNEKPWKPFLILVVPFMLLLLLGPRTLHYIPPIVGVAIQVMWIVFGIWVVLSIWRCARNTSTAWIAVWQIVAVICALPAIVVPAVTLGGIFLFYAP